MGSMGNPMGIAHGESPMGNPHADSPWGFPMGPYGSYGPGPLWAQALMGLGPIGPGPMGPGQALMGMPG